MQSLREYLQSYPGVELIKWEKLEGLVDLPLQKHPEILTYCLAIKPRPLWLTHVVNDERQLDRGFCLYLVLHFPGKDFSLTLAVQGIIDKFPSLTLLFPALNWSEREAQDLFGLQAFGHPDPRPLVLHPGWPKGFFSLRKDYVVGDDRKAFDPAPLGILKAHGDGIFEIPVGPIHAEIIEPGHFRFHTIGEVILHLEAQLFFTHKGIEKLLEGKSMPIFFIPNLR